MSIRTLVSVVQLVAIVGLTDQLAAQSPSSPNDALRESFSTVHDWVRRAADLVPADRYAYRPIGTVRTFGELVGHLADSYVYYCALAAGRDVEWADPVEKGPQDKDTLTRALDDAARACSEVYTANPGNAALVDNLAHTHLHYGNMVTYLRMLSVIPPSSR